ncbi:hypothetical protein JCM30237_29420 [Halolamina litorea]|uniref:Twin-arginine translocation signal domain-containing protein n=1 Tax=Halolamina litorea TaxID=1515593 RepID=A0ABD6BUH0_9EURY|nr:twin-arginine translocation signal domain-containing protein [Halolamina litorea]
MVTHSNARYVDDDDRREFLKALGVGGAVAAGGTGLGAVRDAMSANAASDLAAVGESIRADLTGSIDADLIASQQPAVAEAASELTAVPERGLPTGEPRYEFAAVEEAGRPIYDHLVEVGFFESTTEHLPGFDPAFLQSAVGAFAGSAALAEPLSGMGLDDGAGVDLLSEVVANAEELSEHHWIATDEIPRAEIEFGEYIPTMTRGAAGGALLWLKDLDHHLFTHKVLLTDEIVADATWHGQSMAAGFQLMAEGAKALGGGADVSGSDLTALLSTGFAVQAIAQGLLPQDAYWISEEMRAERRTDLRRASHGN